MGGSKDQPKTTAGVDLGDKYSYLCLIDHKSGEVIEEGRLPTSPEAFKRRFASERPPLRIAIEAGTHSPWVSRVLEECGHEVLVANARKLSVNHVRGAVKSFGARLPKCPARSFHRKASEHIPEALLPALEPIVEQIGSLLHKEERPLRRMQRLLDSPKRRIP